MDKCVHVHILTRSELFRSNVDKCVLVHIWTYPFSILVLNIVGSKECSDNCGQACLCPFSDTFALLWDLITIISGSPLTHCVLDWPCPHLDTCVCLIAIDSIECLSFLSCIGDFMSAFVHISFVSNSTSLFVFCAISILLEILIRS